MTSSSTSLRGLLIYAAVLPLALLVGYLMATPTDMESFVVIALVLSALSLPLMLKWHRPFLFLTWNMTAVLFFLPGRPQVWVAAAFISFLVIMVQKTMLMNFESLRVPSVTMSITFLVSVVFVTAYFTGGVGVRAFGSDVVGGKAYFWILAATLGYFTMKAYPVAPKDRHLYVGLFLLGALTNAIGSSLTVLTPSLYYIFLLFPVDILPGGTSGNISRYNGLAVAGMAGFFYLLSRYKVRELLSFRKPIALGLLIASAVIVLGGGYRSNFLLIGLVFMSVFCFEGLIRSHYAAFFLLGALLTVALVLPFSNRLPMSIQRAISILPVPVSYEARLEAERSTEWRLNMWRVVLPEVPKYFWLGKGIGINNADLDMAERMGNRGPMGQYEVALQTGAYHNGPLTVLIPFGIWGFIGWLWFLGACGRALWLNYKHGDPELKTVNTFLMGFFAARVFYYFIVFGEFRVDYPVFVGIIGLSLSLNAGVQKPARKTGQAEAPEAELTPVTAGRGFPRRAF